MADATPTLLLTRPEAQARRFALDYAARFGGRLPVLISPLTALRFLNEPFDTSGITGVIFTSESGVTAFCRASGRRDMTAWCVGRRTAGAASSEGFAVRSGQGTARDLARLVIEAKAKGPLIWARGSDTAFNIADCLNSAGIDTISLPLYTQEPLSPDPALIALLAGRAPVLLPVFSPRAAARIAALIPDDGAPLWVAAISDAAAEPMRSRSPARLVVAARPDAEAMLDALGGLLAAGHGA